jgi:hypothetical protein
MFAGLRETSRFFFVGCNGSRESLRRVLHPAISELGQLEDHIL